MSRRMATRMVSTKMSKSKGTAIKVRIIVVMRATNRGIVCVVIVNFKNRGLITRP